jgi:hypothetical protein
MPNALINSFNISVAVPQFGGLEQCVGWETS